MSISWSNEDTLKFIKLYRSEPAIWDPKNKLHKDRTMVIYAWERIAESLQISITELKRKKETLMSAFRWHYKKKQDLIRCGMGEEVYKPIWAYYDVMEAFLKDIYESKSSVPIEVDNCVPAEVVCIEVGEQDSGAGSSGIADREIPVNSRIIDSSKLENSEKELANAFHTMDQALASRKQKGEDDCELYGKLLAHKLRKYPESERQEIMYEIDGLLLRRHRNLSFCSVSAPSQTNISRWTSSSANNNASQSSSPSPINRPLSSNSEESLPD